MTKGYFLLTLKAHYCELSGSSEFALLTSHREIQADKATFLGTITRGKLEIMTKYMLDLKTSIQDVCVCMLSHVRLCVTLRDCSRPGSSVHGILQARALEWVAMPSSRGSFRPRR